jgi:hypothetical protein
MSSHVGHEVPKYTVETVFHVQRSFILLGQNLCVVIYHAMIM